MKKFGIFLVTVIMVLSLAACGGKDDFDDQEEIDFEGSLVEGEIGDIMSTQYFDFTVNDVSAYDDEYAGYAAESDYRLLALNITVLNTSQDINVMDNADFILTGSDPEEDFFFSVDDADSLSADFLPSGYEMNPDDEITGNLLFEVPAEMTDFGLSYMEYDEENEEDITYIVYFEVEAYADANADTDEDDDIDGDADIDEDDDIDEDEDTDRNVSNSSGSASGQLGQKMNTDLFDFQVKSATLYAEYGDNPAFDEYQYLVLEIMLENKSQEDVVLYDSDFYVQWDDPDDYEYPESIFLNGKELMDGIYNLPLSGSINATMIYEVPEGADRLKVCFEEYLEDADEPSVYTINFVPGRG